MNTFTEINILEPEQKLFVIMILFYEESASAF